MLSRCALNLTSTSYNLTRNPTLAAILQRAAQGTSTVRGPPAHETSAANRPGGLLAAICAAVYAFMQPVDAQQLGLAPHLQPHLRKLQTARSGSVTAICRAAAATASNNWQQQPVRPAIPAGWIRQAYAAAAMRV
jgi:hypothetical protein